jgi:L-asparagine transporter-like permease
VIVTKRKYSLMMLSGAILILAGLMPTIVSIYDTLLIMMGMVIILVAAIRHLQYGEERERDERTERIRAYSHSYSWQITLIFLLLLFWVDYFGILTLTAQNVIAVTALVMALSTLIFKWYISKKGDVE